MCSAPLTNHLCSAPLTNHLCSAPLTNHLCSAPLTNHLCSTPLTNHLCSAPLTNHLCSAPMQYGSAVFFNGKWVYEYDHNYVLALTRQCVSISNTQACRYACNQKEYVQLCDFIFLVRLQNCWLFFFCALVTTCSFLAHNLHLQCYWCLKLIFINKSLQYNFAWVVFIFHINCCCRQIHSTTKPSRN